MNACLLGPEETEEQGVTAHKHGVFIGGDFCREINRIIHVVPIYHLVLLWIPLPRATWEEGFIWLTHPDHYWSLRTVRDKSTSWSRGRNHGRSCWLACSPRLAQPAFSVIQGQQHRSGTATGDCINHQSWTRPTALPIGQSDGGVFSTVAPSSQMMLRSTDKANQHRPKRIKLYAVDFIRYFSKNLWRETTWGSCDWSL